MKRWMIGLAIMILLSSLGCQAQENKGLFYVGNKACDDDGYMIQGVLDLEVAKYMSNYQNGYVLIPELENRRPSSRKDYLSRAEGNDIKLKGFEVKYEALGIEFEKQFIPSNFSMQPNSSVTAKVNILPRNVIDTILEYWAQNAYADVDNARYYFHVDAEGGTADCTNYTAGDDCHGYACMTNDSGSLSAAGKCMPMCTLESGCAMNCFEETTAGEEGPVTQSVCYTPHSNPSYWCDTGAGDIGYCRPTCFDTGYCPPVTLPDGTVALDYDCIDGYCLPKGSTVNPYNGEDIIVKVKALAEGSNGDDFGSNSMNFTLKVCRGCLLSFGGAFCNSDAEDITQALTDGGYSCDLSFIGQDISVDCSMLSGCAKFLCSEFSAE